nr:MAG TPA: hypothetical protein [Caudoviricetes sp.]
MNLLIFPTKYLDVLSCTCYNEGKGGEQNDDRRTN